MDKEFIDIIHKAYKEYLLKVDKDQQHERLRRELLAVNDGEYINSSVCTCEVDPSWPERIEAALPAIDRAIRQNRQFILRYGETVPIEKARRTSQESVLDLAKHSNYLTVKNIDVVPKKILITENQSTYSVYENRFLYMLLCFIKEFTLIKKDAIRSALNSFSTDISFRKDINKKAKKSSFSVTYNENSRLGAQNDDEIFRRIDKILLDVDSLLKTPLMTEVASAPMLKPPITRTNVLLQDPYFSAALDLFDFLYSYKGQGYTIKELNRQNGIPNEEARNDLAELAVLSSYFAYKHAGYANELDRRYEENLAREKQAERLERDERISALRDRFNIGEAEAEYITLLQDKCAEGDEALKNAAIANQAVCDANKKLDQQKMQEELCKKEALRLNDEISRLDKQNKLDRQAYDAEISHMKQSISDLNASMAEKDAANRQYVEKMNAEYQKAYQLLSEQYHLANARLRATETNYSPDEELSKEEFEELEAQYNAFSKYFKQQWRAVKKGIIKKHIGKKQIAVKESSDNADDGNASKHDRVN